MCRGFLHQHAPGGGKEFKAASPPSLSLGAIGLGAALSAMAVLLRKENIWQNLEIYNGVFQIVRLLYFPLFLLAFRFHNHILGCFQPTVQAISGYMENVFLKAPLSCGKLKKSFSSTEALSRLSRVSSSETMKKLSSTLRNTFKSYRRRAALKAITRKECFAKLEYIGQLSIHDIIILFRYANDVNQMDFQKKRFMLEQSQLVRSMVTAVDMAVAMSRGGQKLKLMVNIERKKGEVDALYFTAVVRIFAEWRSMRLVPEGYSRYAVGLNLAYRDILQNLAKIEDGVHAYMKHYGATPEDDVPLCPTLREVLEFEIETRVHQKLPNLKDGSAASGLLWTKRQLHYQSSLFLNTLQVPYKFATTQAGLAAAYSEVSIPGIVSYVKVKLTSRTNFL